LPAILTHISKANLSSDEKKILELSSQLPLASEETRESLVGVLGMWVKVLGLRNLDNLADQIFIIADMLRENFPHLGVAHIRQAYIWSFSDRYGEKFDANEYGNFNVPYVLKVVGSFNRYRAKIENDLYRKNALERDREAREWEPTKKDQFEAFLASIYMNWKRVQGGLLPIDFGELQYRFFEATNRLNLTEEERDAAIALGAKIADEQKMRKIRKLYDGAIALTDKLNKEELLDQNQKLCMLLALYERTEDIRHLVGGISMEEFEWFNAIGR